MDRKILFTCLVITLLLATAPIASAAYYGTCSKTGSYCCKWRPIVKWYSKFRCSSYHQWVYHSGLYPTLENCGAPLCPF